MDEDQYSFWRRALAGEKVGSKALPVHDGDAQSGFYRTRGSKNGIFLPVAIWQANGTIICLVDGKYADAAEVWSFCCRNAVTEGQYRERIESGKWFDENEAASTSLVHDTTTNNPPTDPAEILKGQIEAASAGVGEFAEIKDDAAAARAQSLRSRLLELSGEADKLKDGLKRPHLEAGKAVDARFQPLVKLAAAGADAIRAALRAHETRKARLAEEARAKADEEARKAAAKAAKAGKPAPAPPPPEPTPAPAATIQGAAGRAASVRVIKVARVVNIDKAFQALKGHKEIIELIAKLAQRAATAGIPVDGVEVTEERDVV